MRAHAANADSARSGDGGGGQYEEVSDEACVMTRVGETHERRARKADGDRGARRSRYALAEQDAGQHDAEEALRRDQERPVGGAGA